MQSGVGGTGSGITGSGVLVGVLVGVVVVVVDADGVSPFFAPQTLELDRPGVRLSFR